MEKLNRRKFLKASAMTGGALMAGNLLKGRTPETHAAVPSSKAGRSEISVPAKKIPVAAEADVVVIGGGPGGFAAALRAARGGANTILIEKYDMPGGVHTIGLQGAAWPVAAGIHTELMRRFADNGYIHTATHLMYPDFNGNPVSHYGGRAARGSEFTTKSFNPEGGGCVMLKMLEEAGVKSMYGTRFLSAAVKSGSGNNRITEVIVENASGMQAVRGKVFVDGSGTAEVAAKAGAPFVRGGGGIHGWPIPGGVLWTMAGIDYLKLVEYQRSSNDWTLDKLISAAKAAGDIQDLLFRPRWQPGISGPGPAVYGDLYIGKPTLDMNPIGGNGGWIFWQNVPYEWALHMDDTAKDEARAKIAMRTFIDAEARFLKKYVPGFENSYMTNVGRYMGIRDARHPIGEYVFTIEDAAKNRTFPDNTATRTSYFAYGGLGNRTFQVPYRCFLPKKIDNLLLTGASMSFSYDVIFMVFRGFHWCMQSGEIAGYAAARSVEKGVVPKKLEWTKPYF